MKVLIVSRSYQTGGAAIVAQRLFKVLRQRPDCEVRMLVMTDDIPADERADDLQVFARSGVVKMWNTMVERAELFVANGFCRQRVFQIDTARYGYRLDRHPWVLWADVVHLHWINQGALSLTALRNMGRQDKRLVWTLHDMWPMTGLCHHAYDCREFLHACRYCTHLSSLPLLRTTAQRCFRRKRQLYAATAIRFVPISQWELEHAQQSALLRQQPLTLIPNPYPVADYNPQARRRKDEQEVVVAVGAARLDDPVKGFDLLLEVSKALAQHHPMLSARLRWVLYGGLRDQSLLAQLQQSYDYLGRLSADAVRHTLEQADVVVCPSRFESLSNALVEGAAAGCVLVSFVTGGQADVMRDGVNGYAVTAYDTRQMADCIARAASELSSERRQRQHDDVAERFADTAVAEQYLRVYATK
ncbi:MAG: glycosyltransferase [Bacteroidaceae bacterium]|nr:glycosyltransferase [Bacteroidaceae bacterium]